MKKKLLLIQIGVLFYLTLLSNSTLSAQIIISQYYEGTGTNKWIELTNTSGVAIDTANPQLKLGLWSIAGSTGNIAFNGPPSNTVNLAVIIPPYGSVLIGNTGNGTEIPYLTASSAAQTSNSVINFNGNDGIALLDANNNILDQFGNGINATDISYVRNTNIMAPSSSYNPLEWASASISTVQNAATNDPVRLNYHLSSQCTSPLSQPSNLVFNAIGSTSLSGSFSPVAADEYLVLYSLSPNLSTIPVNGNVYNTGDTLGNATVAMRGTSSSFNVSNLNQNTSYYFYVFALNSVNCSKGPLYNTLVPLSGTATTQEAPLGYYYGNFHSHSEYSDGKGLPSNNFAFGDTANCMDFLGISEHNHVDARMALSKWPLGRAQAAAATTPNFLAMYGMEWGVISGGGHVIVYGVDKLVGWDPGEYEIYVPKSTYTGSNGLFSVINSFKENNAFATLAHPNNSDYNGIMSAYDPVADDAVVGSAVENGPSTSTNVTYSDFPSSMFYLSYYRNMLAKGYHLGPTIDHDNHNVTHGHTATSRTVVLSPSLTEKEILSSMRKMRFYATEDCSAVVDFKINNKPLGTIMTASGSPNITVTTVTNNPVTSLKIYSGVSGSGSNATVLTSTTSGTINYTHTALANMASRYYYVDITESDGKRTITAPIWFTRNDNAARMADLAVAEFFTVAETDKAIVKWITTNEKINQNFTIERSFDDISYQIIDRRKGKGYSEYPQNYYIIDEKAYQQSDVVYYRLNQYNENGTVVFTDTRKVMRYSNPRFTMKVYPNPTKDDAKIRIDNTHGEEIQLTMVDMSGKLVYEQSLQTIEGGKEYSLPMSNLPSGVYIVFIKSGSYTLSEKVIKL